MFEIIDGKKISAEIKAEIKAEVAEIKKKSGKIPGLAVILVGNDAASSVYVNSKEKSCVDMGFHSEKYLLSEEVSEKELLELVETLNKKEKINGILVQLPLPKHIDAQKVLELIVPEKDVDGFHPMNVGKMVLGMPSYISATPGGIMELISRYNIKTSGKHCVIIGRSNIVGRPLANLLSQKTQPGDCTVTICHSHTKDIKEITLQADILIAALGKPGFVRGDMVKSGAVVIDVGITRVPANNKSGFKLAGDVLFDEVAPKASFITPVPGGVGPMTIISLLKNTLKASGN